MNGESNLDVLLRDMRPEMQDTVVAKGTELIKPLRAEPWGMREFGLRTIDGHRIMIGQEIGT